MASSHKSLGQRQELGRIQEVVKGDIAAAYLGGECGGRSTLRTPCVKVRKRLHPWVIPRKFFNPRCMRNIHNQILFLLPSPFRSEDLAGLRDWLVQLWVAGNHQSNECPYDLKAGKCAITQSVLLQSRPLRRFQGGKLILRTVIENVRPKEQVRVYIWILD